VDVTQGQSQQRDRPCFVAEVDANQLAQPVASTARARVFRTHVQSCLPGCGSTTCRTRAGQGVSVGTDAEPRHRGPA
ncbi:MAG: hypothetical protein G01um101477_504, partial [Candidatus Doudnabacteria bacterium Gr01-1014_77]